MADHLRLLILFQRELLLLLWAHLWRYQDGRISWFSLQLTALKQAHLLRHLVSLCSKYGAHLIPFSCPESSLASVRPLWMMVFLEVAWLPWSQLSCPYGLFSLQSVSVRYECVICHRVTWFFVCFPEPEAASRRCHALWMDSMSQTLCDPCLWFWVPEMGSYIGQGSLHSEALSLL